MPFCAIITCKKQSKVYNLTNGNISFHRFPVELKTKLKWVEATGRKDWVPTKTSTLCSIHFSDNAFVLKAGKRYLKPEAVPTKEIVRLSSEPLEIIPSPSSTSILNASTPKKRKMSVESYSPSSSNSTPRKRKLKNIIAQKNNTIQQQRQQIKRIQAQNRRLKKKVNKIQDLLEDLKSKFLMRTEDLHALENINLQVHELVTRVVENDKTGIKTTKRFPPALRSFALTLHYYSPKAYKYVRETFNTCLPHPQAIKKWYQSVSGDPGFTSESLEALQKKSGCTDHPIYANLVLDEMAIRRRIEWDGIKMHGHVDIGNGISNDYVCEAREALVFLVTAINGSWKVPVGFFFVDGVTGSQRAELVTTCLELIHETGVKIVSITFDGCTSNISMITHLGCSLSNPIFKHPITKQSVACVLDPSHMIKLIRNALQCYRVFVDDHGQKIEWAYLEKLNELQESEKFHLANKLRLQHIRFENQKMKVKLATQLFSLSVADALDFCRNDLKLLCFQDSAATAHFLRIINNYFDILNSRSMHHHGFKKALNSSNAENIFDFIDKAVTYILSLKCLDGTRLTISSRKVGFIGFLGCAATLKLFYRTLIETKALIYLPFYKISQDHLEMLFCNIRAHGGANNNPTARQFVAAYKKLLVHIQLKDTGHGNCTALENLSILNCSSAIKRINTTSAGYDKDNDIDEDDDMEEINMFCDNISQFSTQIIAYIAGNVVHVLIKKIHCDICISALLSNTTTSEHKFIILKDKGGLLYPSDDVIKICKTSEAVIRTYTDHLVKINKDIIVNKILRNFIGTAIFDDISFHQFSEYPQSNHLTDLIKAIVEKYMNIRLHFFLKNTNRLPKRQLLNKYVLFQGQ